MNKQAEDKLKAFLEDVDNLFADIENWSNEAGLTSRYTQTSINEEACGEYTAPVLSIFDNDEEKIAELRPVAAWNIAAEGRVDINGMIDSANIVKLKKGGSYMKTTMKIDGCEEKTKNYFYQGIKDAGWYWIENDRHAKGHKLTIENFFKLLSEVSDYERA